MTAPCICTARAPAALALLATRKSSRSFQRARRLGFQAAAGGARGSRRSIVLKRNTRARGVPYSTPSAVGRHVLTLDDSVGIPQYPPARGASRPLFYPLWTTVYSHPFQGPLSGRPQPWATLSSVGSSTESMPSSEPSSRPGPLTSIPVPYSGIDPQLLGFWLLSGTRVGIRTCDLSIKGSNPLPTRLWRAGLF